MRRHLAFDPEMIAGHPHREVTGPHRLQRVQQFLRASIFPFCSWDLTLSRRRVEDETGSRSLMKSPSGYRPSPIDSTIGA